MSCDTAQPTVADLRARLVGRLVVVEPLAAVETKRLLLTQAFEVAGCRRAEFKTGARNERSRGALDALSARFEGVLPKHMVVQHGAERDSAYYAVIDDEWPALKTSLQRRLQRTANRSGEAA
ncbi:MAG TPA: GNAT family protein [Solirubrobacteraceae bacterium]